jgi:hypothetical protein
MDQIDPATANTLEVAGLGMGALLVGMCVALLIWCFLLRRVDEHKGGSFSGERIVIKRKGFDSLPTEDLFPLPTTQPKLNLRL